jgi:ABC-2 type transport system ATP-binding protein
VERVCDRIGMLVHGRLVLEKPLAELLHENLSPAFDIELKSMDSKLTAKLKELDCVTEAVSEHNKLSVTVSDADAGSKALLSFFSGQSIPLLSFSLRKNSLEDIFIREAGNNDAKHS